MSDPSTPSDLLDPQAVEREYGILQRTQSQWRYLGRGPTYVKVGRMVRYRRSDIEAWLNANTVEPGRVGAA